MRKITLALTLLFALPAYGQASAARWVVAMTRYGGSGTLGAFTAPDLRLHWAVTAVGALTASRMDEWATSAEVRNRIMPNLQAEIGDKWGDPVAAAIILPSIFLADKMLGYSIVDTKKRLEFAVAGLVSVGVVTVVAKDVFRRERPNAVGHRSFPSGHTSISFAVAEVARQLYGNRVSVPFYLLAANTALSRIHDNKHYPSDVVAGAGLGIGIVRGFSLVEVPTMPLSFSLQFGRTGFQGNFLLSFDGFRFFNKL
ncbi:MAG: phosphatase PAP2 family protein [Candidatus Marinimicrobia bacterium]|nr:phosphatase PAP2 family protein [Candidatus Neomarinimicrobiota bacterium]